MVRNIHERRIAADAHEAGALLNGLATTQDRMWPRGWPPMRFAGEVAPGVRGGHGPIRYTVDSLDPGRRVTFRFTAPKGLVGTHGFEVRELDANNVMLVHRLEARTRGWAWITWPLLWRPLHDALIEDCLDQAEHALTPATPTSAWPPYVSLLRGVAKLAAAR